MPRIIDNSQIGKIVLFLYPTPNSLKLPSGLYKNTGFIVCTIQKIITNKTIAATVTFSAINCLNIGYL